MAQDKCSYRKKIRNNQNHTEPRHKIYRQFYTGAPLLICPLVFHKICVQAHSGSSNAPILTFGQVHP
jgi:hypothetical protein